MLFFCLPVLTRTGFIPQSCGFWGWVWGGGAVHGITNNLAGRPLGCGFVLWAVLCGHAPLPKRFCVWAAFCGAVLLTSMLAGRLCGPPSAPPPSAHAFSLPSSPHKDWFHTSVLRVLGVIVGWGAVHGITNNLAGRPLGCGFVLWAVLCGHAPLPKRFCVWAAFCRAVLLTSMLVGCLCGPPSAPPPLCSCFFLPSSHPSVLPIGYKRLSHGIHC